MSAPEMGFGMAEADDGERVALSLTGDLDLAETDRLSTRLTALRETRRTVQLDLSGLEFIDSSGLACLTGAVEAARAADVPLEVGRQLNGQVRRLVEIAHAEVLLWPEDGSGLNGRSPRSDGQPSGSDGQPA